MYAKISQLVRSEKTKAMGSETPLKLPNINFSKQSLRPGTDSWLSACTEVRRALEEYGCFMAVFDKVTSELHSSIFRAMAELFDLPTEIKVLNTSQKPYHGYVGQHPIIPHHESMGIDNAATQEGAQAFTRTMWPAGNEHFSESICSYSKVLAELHEIVMRMVFESYGIKNGYESLNESWCYLLRVMKNLVPKSNEDNVTFPCHSDKSFMTILQQDQVRGLEIETRDGNWIAFDPPSHSLCVMAGDAFLAWSNGRIHSPIHRVIMSGNQERYSVGLFSFNKGILNIPDELVDEEHPLQFKAFDHYGLVHFYSSAEGRKAKCVPKVYCGV